MFRSLLLVSAVLITGCSATGHKPFGELGSSLAGVISDNPGQTEQIAEPEQSPSVKQYSTMGWETIEKSYILNGEKKSTVEAYISNNYKEWISAKHNGKNWSFSIETPEINRTPNNTIVAVLFETEGNKRMAMTGWVYEGVVNVLESYNPGKTDQLANWVVSENWLSVSYDTERFNGKHWKTDEAEYLFTLNGSSKAMRQAKL